MNTEPHGYRVLMKLLFDGEPPAWRDRAACADADPSLFHTAGRTAAAKAVCATCPVLAECRENQLSWEANGPARYRDNAFGVVGGLSGAERRRIHYPARNAKDVA
ncbi:WhiB family transcriptional regulator [Lentzea sp. BCCO 10_0061]|uniref:WhiB family transcriptional regulator n=1 Tax=Lentzea sokolovensis TaxID=3095429 RepID=A0ABU4UYR0_9PSEU|nr:WhiB family transcriptional regulator [Lentzea sp. BCCO 10_0061]MDX8144683.1 WhiB family transcriptional regulator [Lentzea sp. BCCO 10_0061]